MLIYRAVCVLGLLCTAGQAGEALSTWRGAPLMVSRFSDAPDNSLISCVKPDAACHATTEIVTTDPVSGLAIRQKHQWLAKPGVLVISSTLTNPGKAAVTFGRIGLVDWGFRVSGDQDGLRYRALTYRNNVWYDSTYWTGPDWTRVGKNWHHPGKNTPSVRRFTAPRDGRVTITGRVYKGDTDKGGGDGVRVSIRHGAKTVWKGEIDGDDAKGLSPAITLAVRKGDAIRFVVHKRGKIYRDTTYWDPAIEYDDGERFRASDATGRTAPRRGDRHARATVRP